MVENVCDVTLVTKAEKETLRNLQRAAAKLVSSPAAAKSEASAKPEASAKVYF